MQSFFFFFFPLPNKILPQNCQLHPNEGVATAEKCNLLKSGI